MQLRTFSDGHRICKLLASPAPDVGPPTTTHKHGAPGAHGTAAAGGQMLPERRSALDHVGQGGVAARGLYPRRPGTRPRDVRQPRQRGRLADRRQARVGERRDSAHARLLLQMACARAPSAKAWMKLALLKRECDGGAGELPTLDDTIAKNPTSTGST